MEALLYMLAGGALVLAGIIIGQRMQRPPETPKKETPIAEELPPISEEDIKKTEALREQWNNLMRYDGREQKVK